MVMSRKGGDSNRSKKKKNATHSSQNGGVNAQQQLSSSDVVSLRAIAVLAVVAVIIAYLEQTIASSSFSSLLLLLVQQHQQTNSNEEDTLLVQQKKNFINWFIDNGGYVHPNLTLDYFDEEGTGLRAIGTIQRNETIFKVPQSIIMSKQDGIKMIMKNVNNDNINNNIQSQLLEWRFNDIEIIALALFMEDCSGDSFFDPYLKILPKAEPPPPPLLFTWDDASLNLLQDEALSQMARATHSRLYNHVWNSDIVQQHLLLRGGGEESESSSRCFTWSTFQRYYAIVSSRTMMIPTNATTSEEEEEEAATPYLVPMADMINHGPSLVPADKDDAAGRKSYADFHLRDTESGSITILADRHAGTAQQQQQQLLEEYSQMDNSLYLTMYGFVPTDNPYHCAIISLSQFPPLQTPQYQFTLNRMLSLLHDDAHKSLCIRRDYSILDDEEPLAGMLYPFVYGIDDGETTQQQRAQRERCAAALTSTVTTTEYHSKLLRSECMRRDKAIIAPSSVSGWRKALSYAAKGMLQKKKTSLEEDMDFLQRLNKLRSISSSITEDNKENSKIQNAILGLQFRIEEKNVLVALATS